ncbi:hypothetical protein QFZ55_002976 [Streptomyces luteogriseus]|nr:hypothetical protein [Streptomyces luteogriseus]
MRSMEESVTEQPAPPPAQGEEEHPCLALANSAMALPGGRTLDLLGTPGQANHWLTQRDLAPVDAGMREMCATQLRSLREQIRSLFAARVDGVPALPAAVSAINDAMTRVPTAPLLRWDDKTGPYRTAPHPTTAIVDLALATSPSPPTPPTCSPPPRPSASPPAAPRPATATCSATAAATGAPPAAATAPARPGRTPAAPSSTDTVPVMAGAGG